MTESHLSQSNNRVIANASGNCRNIRASAAFSPHHEAMRRTDLPFEEIGIDMADERPVALALVTQTQLDMLGSSLKVVFRVDDNAEQFAALLRALDQRDDTAEGR